MRMWMRMRIWVWAQTKRWTLEECYICFVNAYGVVGSPSSMLFNFHTVLSTKITFTSKWTNIWDNNNNSSSNNKIISSENELYIYSEWLPFSLYFSFTCSHSMLSLSFVYYFAHTQSYREKLNRTKRNEMKWNESVVHFVKTILIELRYAKRKCVCLKLLFESESYSSCSNMIISRQFAFDLARHESLGS